MGWYESRYGDDPSTDNAFGREDLRLRHTPMLRAFLSQGGALRDFPRASGKGAHMLLTALDHAITRMPPRA